ncbi:hypothetical protein B0H11DRAFT_1923901 [Mycena galericulata]|nr:hypothetical protein B0H11DRAFT_1923901 [Mycena galericulata]
MSQLNSPMDSFCDLQGARSSKSAATRRRPFRRCTRLRIVMGLLFTIIVATAFLMGWPTAGQVFGHVVPATPPVATKFEPSKSSVEIYRVSIYIYTCVGYSTRYHVYPLLATSPDILKRPRWTADDFCHSDGDDAMLSVTSRMICGVNFWHIMATWGVGPWRCPAKTRAYLFLGSAEVIWDLGKNYRFEVRPSPEPNAKFKFGVRKIGPERN